LFAWPAYLTSSTQTTPVRHGCAVFTERSAAFAKDGLMYAFFFIEFTPNESPRDVSEESITQQSIPVDSAAETGRWRSRCQ
jgi:hypothetical protein